jgi:multidrug resistance efflux pump
MLHQPTDAVKVSSLPALSMVKSSRRIRIFAKFVLAGLVLAICGMAFLPWQQTSRGTGRIIAFVPQERQQTVHAPVKGIVTEVAPGLREGDPVKRDQEILRLTPAALQLEEQTRSQISDLENKMGAIRIKAETFRQNVKDWEDARDATVKAAQDLIESALSKLESRQRLVPAYEAKIRQARQNFERAADLQKRGATAEREVEILQRDYDVAKAELDSLLADVQAAEHEVSARREELNQRRSEFQTRVDSARASEQGAYSELASVQKDIRELTIKLDELQQLTIRAPRDGTIFRLPVFERGQVVREGEPLFTIVPETRELAVELWVSGLDVPLVETGDHVRLQFEGWPAIQFAGWPSVAVGTFGGVVVAIDDSDDGQGRFRLQIRPDPADSWPDPVYLRQGMRANGWVMLREVRLGFELWRLLNGFPPYRSDGTFEKVSLPKIKVN